MVKMFFVLNDEDIAILVRNSDEIKRKLDLIMATQAENQQKIDAIVSGLEKVREEVLDLKRRYDEGQTLDFTRAEELLGEVDQVNEDLVTPGETPVEGGETPTPEEPTA